jgi:membrane-bound ClpP family serine protease
MTTTTDMIDAQLSKITAATNAMHELNVHLRTLPLDTIARRAVNEGVDLNDAARVSHRVADLIAEQGTDLRAATAGADRIGHTLRQLIDLIEQARAGARY